jgi:hypothetical protein
MRVLGVVIHEEPRLAYAELAAEHLAKLVGQRRHPAFRGPHGRLVVRVGVAHEHIPGLIDHSPE